MGDKDAPAPSNGDKEVTLPSDEKNGTDIMPPPPPTETPIIVK